MSKPMANAEDLIRQQLQKAPAGTVSPNELKDLPAQIIKRYGGDAEALREMGIKIDLPDPVQSFGESHVDLSSHPQMYLKFLDLLGTQTHPDYQNQDLKQTILSLKNNSLFGELSGEEKQVVADHAIADYGDLAKEKLRGEFPVIDQLVMEQQMNNNDQSGGNA